MELNLNFWENLSYLLSGVVVAGVLAAVSQIINIKTLTRNTKFNVCIKKEEPHAEKRV